VFLGNGDGSFQTTNFNYLTGYSTSVAVGDFSGDGLPDLAVTDLDSNSVSILDNDGIWNGPAPGPSGAPRRTFAPLEAVLPPPQPLEARWPQTSAAMDLPTNALPRQPLLDWLGPPSNGPEPLAIPHAVAWSQEAWDAFFVAGLFEFSARDLAPRPSPP
jgi:hypothetical protein